MWNGSGDVETHLTDYAHRDRDDNDDDDDDGADGPGRSFSHSGGMNSTSFVRCHGEGKG